ncbi:MAG: D-alanyl-D-alanine carboxypeptidase [Candidatus Binataceae bacterium]
MGLTQGLDNISAALDAEQQNLASHYGITRDEYHFVDGSGGGDTSAINRAVTQMLADMIPSPTFQTYFNAMPSLGVDGSLSFVKDFQSDPSLAGATGQVRAKPGSLVVAYRTSIVLEGQALADYIETKSGKQLVFQLVVNNVPLTSINGVFQVFQDEGKITAILWRHH